MSRLSLAPYINFQGRAREALEFYHTVLGGKLDFQTQGDRVATGVLDVDGAMIVGSDGHPSYPPTVGDNWGIALRGTDKERISKAFDALAEGGQVNMPLTAQPGGEFGWLKDKYGVAWTVSVVAA
jgi:PhnB protein